MPKLAFTFLRFACIGCGLLQFIGSVWFYAGDYALLRGMYSNAPSMSLLILGVCPAKMWSYTFSRLVLIAIALVGAFRAIQMLIADLSTSGGFDLSKAFEQVVGVALLLLMIWAASRRTASLASSNATADPS